jgi:uncharacterized BrkB/YihY/UPF0761 family membrane protein
MDAFIASTSTTVGRPQSIALSALMSLFPFLIVVTALAGFFGAGTGR